MISTSKLPNAVAEIRDGVLAFVASQVVWLAADALISVHAPLPIKLPLIGLAGGGYMVTCGLVSLAFANAQKAFNTLRD